MGIRRISNIKLVQRSKTGNPVTPAFLSELQIATAEQITEMLENVSLVRTLLDVTDHGIFDEEPPSDITMATIAEREEFLKDSRPLRGAIGQMMSSVRPSNEYASSHLRFLRSTELPVRGSREVMDYLVAEGLFTTQKNDRATEFVPTPKAIRFKNIENMTHSCPLFKESEFDVVSPSDIIKTLKEPLTQMFMYKTATGISGVINYSGAAAFPCPRFILFNPPFTSEEKTKINGLTKKTLTAWSRTLPNEVKQTSRRIIGEALAVGREANSVLHPLFDTQGTAKVYAIAVDGEPAFIQVDHRECEKFAAIFNEPDLEFRINEEQLKQQMQKAKKIPQLGPSGQYYELRIPTYIFSKNNVLLGVNYDFSGVFKHGNTLVSSRADSYDIFKQMTRLYADNGIIG